MAEKILYEEDINDISDAMTYMLEHPNIPRMDIKLHSTDCEASIYWAGNVLRVDLKGYKEQHGNR